MFIHVLEYMESLIKFLNRKKLSKLGSAKSWGFSEKKPFYT